MDFLLNRYRNLTVLLIVIVGQLLMLAYQVKTNKDIPLIRIWAVSTVTPVEEVLEWTRRHTIGYVEDYFVLLHIREQNEKLKHDLDQAKLENHFLRNELSTADRVQQLKIFQDQTPSRTLATRVIGNGTGANSRVVFVDRGSASGVEDGMAVITPDGIVGKVVAAYPTASLVMLITDQSFAAGVISQKNHVHGTLKGLGGPKCRVDYVQNEEKVEPGELFFTSGDDGIFPRGFPVGQVASVQDGRSAKEIYLTPSGWQGGLDEVLIVTEGVHQPIPEQQIATAPVKIQPPPADTVGANAPQASTAALSTDADRLRQEYKQIGDKDNIQFGEGRKAPDFSKVGKQASPVTAQAPAQLQTSPKPQTPPTGTAPAPTTQAQETSRPQTAAPAVNTAEKKPPFKAASSTPTTAIATPPKPKVRAPLLVTDPTDADPPVTGDRNTEILPPAPPPKPKPAKTTTGNPNP